VVIAVTESDQIKALPLPMSSMVIKHAVDVFEMILVLARTTYSRKLAIDTGSCSYKAI
jgi:hypothetical protein